MSKKKIIIYIIILVILAGGILYFVMPKEGADVRYLTDSSFCKKDSDCTLQATGCSCACSIPINIYHVKKLILDIRKLNCSSGNSNSTGSNFVCMLYCPYQEVKCEDNKCIGVRIPIEPL